MTAFGRASTSTPVGLFTVEIQSVNRKYLEMQLSLPKELNQFDPEIRKLIAQSIGRGQVVVRIHVLYENEAPFTVKPNVLLAERYQEAAKALGNEKLSPEFLLQQPGILVMEESISDSQAYKTSLQDAISQALTPFLQMKILEGEQIQKDILKRLNLLETLIEKVERLMPDAPNRYREKLLKLLEEYLPGKMTEDDLLKEVVLYASKLDTTEEIVLFRSHLKQFRDVIGSGKHTIGKTLDILVQELNREANTIASKAVDGDIKKSIVEIKSELERIREQVQNIE